MLKTKFENRKDLVKAVGEYANAEPQYMGAPTFAYRIRNFTVDKDGNVTGETAELEKYLTEKGFVEKSDTDITGINIHFPIEGIDSTAIVNLLNTLYSRQYLINKAVGETVIDIPTEFINRIQNKQIEEISFDGLTGVSIEDNNLIFNYPNAENREMYTAYFTLVSKALDRAKKSKHSRVVYSEPENEKYYMRSWLIRLGLGGKEHSDIRKLLLKNLKGNASFKTDEEMEVFKEKHRKGNR